MKNSSKQSARNIMEGVASSHDGIAKTVRKRFVRKPKELDVAALYEEIIAGSREDLAQAITLIESTLKSDQDHAQQLLQKTMQLQTEYTIRVGISGVPGAGKSTFIEMFGLYLCRLGFKVAVLAIDPSSSVTGGSVLGDKTRMEKLASNKNAFIRPSPTSGTLGGVHRKTRETMLLCEAAGYDVILVETVGVGQSEIAVRNMVDFFTLLALTGAGDDLQGMKKGIMEITDLVIVHKADGENVRLASRTVREYKQILHYLQPATPGWESTALPVSSIEMTGHEVVWGKIVEFKEQMMASGYWQERRQAQTKEWFQNMVHNRLIEDFFRKPGKQAVVEELTGKIMAAEITVTSALDTLFEDE